MLFHDRLYFSILFAKYVLQYDIVININTGLIVYEILTLNKSRTVMVRANVIICFRK